jgi:outer membrane lipoprotein carrier protein
MKNWITIFCILLLPALIQGQNDPEAVKVLDRFSAMALSSPSVSMKFRLITVNLMEKQSDTISGSLIMAKDQYKLELPDNITWFNGTATWSYLIAEKEVTITKPDKKDNSFISRPSAIFTLYKKGYKTRVIEDNAANSIIDLYPEETKSDMVRIRLSISKNSGYLTGAEYKRKDGITSYLIVDDYNLKVKPDAATFVFNPDKYKGVEIIDMR